MVLGGATWAIIGMIAFGLIPLWVFFRSKLLDPRKNAKIARHLPDIVLKAADGDTSSVTALLNAGADPNAQGPTGQTALMLAARNGHSEVVAVLLDRGADPTRRTKSGSTAEDIAKTYKQDGCAMLLNGRTSPR
jgi:ankyrin repeat protein